MSEKALIDLLNKYTDLRVQYEVLSNLVMEIEKQIDYGNEKKNKNESIYELINEFRYMYGIGKSFEYKLRGEDGEC